MFEFFKKDKTKKLIENRMFLTEMSGTELQTLLKIDFVYQKTKQKYSDVFITSNVQYDKMCSFIKLYTFCGKSIVIDLLSLTTMQKYDDEIAKITDIRIANEREAKTFLNNYLNYQWNDDLKNNGLFRNLNGRILTGKESLKMKTNCIFAKLERNTNS